MTLSDVALYVVPTLAVLLSGATLAVSIWRDRNKPPLDEATVKDLNNRLNARRDKRVLDLENWADKLRPYLRGVKVRDDMMCDLIREAYTKLGLPMPEIAPLADPPEMPQPVL